jgi:hypothetical protein
MQDRSSYDYIQIGLILRLLRSGSLSYDFTKTHVETLFELLDDVGFEVSKSFTDSLDFSDFFRRITNKVEEKSSDILSDKDKAELKKLISSLEEVVFAESSIKKIYTIPSRRYNIKYLLNSPDKLFKDGHFNSLTDLAKIDITSSAKCIVFGEATASAFHVLRATEDTLKQYYFLHRKQKRLPKPMWANMLEQLKTKKTNKPPKALLDS